MYVYMLSAIYCHKMFLETIMIDTSDKNRIYVRFLSVCISLKINFSNIISVFMTSSIAADIKRIYANQ